MTVATLIWKTKPLNLPSLQLGLPLAIYLSNFAFATVLSLAAGIYLPILLGIFLGVAPLLLCYKMAVTGSSAVVFNSEITDISGATVPVASVGVAQK